MATGFQHVKITPDGVNLTLNQVEAEVLMEVLMSVGGDPAKSHRGTCDNIKNALKDAGIASPLLKFSSKGSVWFPEITKGVSGE